MADLHRKIGAALSHKGERSAAIEHYQQGINLLKDGPPRIELVRLYEEAAWLYLHTGDNMLAIYASEKALRLAERLGETRAASRAHGIFGRVFGRIGDTREGAPEPRARRGARARLGRRRDDPGAVRPRAATRDLGGRRGGRARRLRGGAGARRAGGDAARAGGAARLAGPAGGLLPPNGSAWSESTEASADTRRARGTRGEALPAVRAARSAALARGAHRGGHRALPPRPRAGRAGGLVRDRVPGAVRAGARAARPGRLRRAPPPRSTAPSTSASEPACIAQSIQATAARAVVLALAQRPPGRRARPPRGRRAGRAPALPDRPRRGARGARRVRRGPGRGRGAAGGGRDQPGGSSTGRSRPPAAACWPASACWATTTSAPASCWRRRPWRASAWACPTSPRRRARAPRRGGARRSASAG